MEIAWNAPSSLPVQTSRPNTWLNCDAASVLDMLKGSYLLNGEYRTIQDPESLRAWSVLRDSVLMQINTSDQNPAVVVDLKPEDSWENPASNFYSGGPAIPGGSGHIPVALDAVGN